jgi:CheY-like chemotaxis protein
VLVVDDNPTNRCILEELLRGWHMRPETATSAAEALVKMRQRNAEQAPFQLVLTDLHMPETDGFGLVEQMHNEPAALQHVVVLMVTSGEHRGDLARCRNLGIASYLTKPVRRSELRTAICAALAKRQYLSNPAKFAEPVKPERSRPEISPGVRSLHILLAEDNPVNQLVACGILRKAGHKVEVAQNGLEVMAKLPTQPFDLVLMDIQMPGMDGFEATAAIRELETRSGAHLPIIAMTAHAMAGYKEKCLAAGMDGYLTKPIRHNLLLQALSEISAAVPAA